MPDYMMPVFSSVTEFADSCIMHFITTGPSNRLFSRLRFYYYRGRLGGCAGFFNSMTGLSIYSPESVFIGRDVAINKDVMIDASDGGSITIGDHCLIGPYTLLRAADHAFDDVDTLIREQGHHAGTIIIQDNCWIGGHVTITSNVTIGSGSIIGANSVVTKDIPPMSVAAGNPAVVLKSRHAK